MLCAGKAINVDNFNHVSAHIMRATIALALRGGAQLKENKGEERDKRMGNRENFMNIVSRIFSGLDSMRMNVLTSKLKRYYQDENMLSSLIQKATDDGNLTVDDGVATLFSS